MTESSVAVIGLGLIGGSIAAACRRAGIHTLGYDASRSAMSTAGELGLVDETASSAELAVAGAGIVVLAAPVTAIVAMLPTIDRAADADAVILDAGSVKAPVVAQMESLLGAARAIGGHPIAGREASGPAWADAELFAGRPFVLSASPRTSSETCFRAEAFVRALGAAPVFMAADAHDRAVAYTSHAPQVLSSALALALEGKDTRLAGPAVLDMTRVARSDAALWRDILLANRGNVAEAARGVVQELNRVVTLLERDDGVAIETVLRQGADSAKALRAEKLL